MTKEDISEARVGRSAPDFVARDLAGNEVRLSSLVGVRKALILFYRGGWCPFCNEQLAAIARDYERFQELNAIVVAVSGEVAEKGKDLLQKLHLPFVLLTDTSFEAIDRYGVRDTNVSEMLRARGISQLPKPSAFVIDAAGIVRYKYVGKSAPDRPKNEDLLRALGEADKPLEPNAKADEGDICELPEGTN
jgi:peroxiredoxin